MAKSEAVGAAFDNAERINVMLEPVKKQLRDLGVTTMTMKMPDAKKLQESIDAAKKKAQFFLTLSGTDKLSLELRVGSTTLQIGSVDLTTEKDMEKRRDVLNSLARGTGLITEKDVWKWHETHYDEVELSFFRGTIQQMELDQKKLTEQRDKLKALDHTSYYMRNELKEWAGKHSWKHYIEFLEKIEDGVAAKTIFDTYIKDGAAYPVNLPEAMKKPIEAAVKEGRKPDFAPAEKLIGKMVDVKIIPGFTKELLPAIVKEIQRLTTDIPDKKKRYAVASSGK